MEHHLKLLVIFALVLANISPACAFISGQHSTVMEICTADGIRMITIETGASDQSEQESHAHSNECNFCFNQSLGKIFGDDAVFIYRDDLPDYTVGLRESQSFHDISRHVYIARAPPVFS